MTNGTLPITVQPGMTLPIQVGSSSSGASNSMNVSFAVQAPNFNGASILISICIRIRIGRITINIYYTRYAVANGQIEIFNSLLPVGSTIEEIVPSYDVVELVQPS